MLIPAAGPATPSTEVDNMPTKMPPTMPLIRPAENGAPEAKAMPKQSGRETRNSEILALKSFLKCFLLNKLDRGAIYYNKVLDSFVEGRHNFDEILYSGRYFCIRAYLFLFYIFFSFFLLCGRKGLIAHDF